MAQDPYLRLLVLGMQSIKKGQISEKLDSWQMYFASIFLLLLQLSQCPKKAETHMLSSAEEVDALCRWKSLQKARRPGTSTLWAGMLKAAAVSSDLALTLPAAAALFPFPLVFYLPALKPSFKHCH